jgi:hypothetical protein
MYVRRGGLDVNDKVDAKDGMTSEEWCLRVRVRVGE